MKKYALVLSALTVLLLPAGVQACDCGCDDPPEAPIHFKNGIPPNGPVTADPGLGDTERFTTSYSFHDYGPAAAPVQPYMPPKPNS
jgi:hypothetical protein